jgi:multicomponent Na+:H+ antiporter subunit B
MTTGPRDGQVPFDEWDLPRQGWMLSGECRDNRDRTLLLEVATRTLFPTMLVFSLYLLLVGHYSPGGGFAGGLVAGLAFVLRYIAGGGTGLGAVVAVRSPVLIGSGLMIAVLTGLAPLLVGAPVLSSAYLSVELPLIGTVSTQTSLLLDAGVYLLIVGTVLDLLRSLGAGIERDMHDAGELP